MAVVSAKQLLDAGAHFGHATSKWHPKMKDFIYGSNSGIYIFDLRKTLDGLKSAYEYVVELSAKGGKVLFVGTKIQARDIIFEQAQRSNSFFINERWLGGALTNFNTVKQSIAKLRKMEDAAGEDNTYPGMIKKEAVRMDKNRMKMEAVLGGIKDMRKMPAALFIMDIKKESIAVQEAKKLGIPVIAVVDTNCNPEGIDYIIPGNDDSLRSIELFSSVIAAAAIQGRKSYEAGVQAAKEEKEKQKKDVKKTAEK